MAFTTDQYNALKEAIAQGALRVKYADKEVEYRSLDDMLRLLNLMEKDLGLASGGIRFSLAQFTTGLTSGYDNCD